jgi:adenine-specific DNA-methyltransferase
VTEQLALVPGPRIHAHRRPDPVVRSVQYLGSKARLVEIIAHAMNELDPSAGRALDLFSGSGVVAAHLARTREVTALDIQEYARVLASALLKPWRATNSSILAITEAAAEAAASRLAAPALSALRAYELKALGSVTMAPDRLCELVEFGSIAGARAGTPGIPPELAALLEAAAQELEPAESRMVLTHQFGGVYFSYSQATMLDSLLTAVRDGLDQHQSDTAIAATMRAASVLVTSIGSHFAQPVRPRESTGAIKTSALRAVAARRARTVSEIFIEQMRSYASAPSTHIGSAAVAADYRDFLSTETATFSIAYADPPYTRDHYSRFYHVLETMARGDQPQLSTVLIGDLKVPSRGLYREDRHQSPFSIRTQVRGAFEVLFGEIRRRGIPLVLSYSSYSGGTVARPKPRLLTIDEIVALAAERFTRVEVRSAGAFRHSKFNAAAVNGEAHAEAEELIICEP